MGSEAKPITGQIRIDVSDDRLQAWIVLPGALLVRAAHPGEADLLAALTEAGIVKSASTLQRVREYAKLLHDATECEDGGGPPEIPERYLIAAGKAAVEAVDEKFEWDEAFVGKLRDWQGDAPVDYYTLNSILTIDADTLVGRICGGTPGKLGMDVFGQEVPPHRMKGVPLKVGNGLRVTEDDPPRIVTEVSGWLVQGPSEIRMSELLEIASDVDFKSGNVDSVVDVHVRGDVKPNFTVKTTKSLTIDRAVESAELLAGGDIQVRGGLFGQESGRRIRAGGTIVAHICDAADVEAAGDIRVVKEIINSDVRTTGTLRIENGSIIGGKVYARDGVKVKNAGSELGVSTEIAVGTPGLVLYRAQQLDGQIRKHHEQAEQIRTRMQPLLANIKRLLPAQREQATALISKADEIELAADHALAERDRLLEEAKPQTNPGVDVIGMLNPGVVLVFGLRETTIKTVVKGPMRVEERKVDGVTEIVIVNQLTGSLTPLPSATVDLGPYREAEKKSGGLDGHRKPQPDDGRA
jgi:uncharacterized protein (DUF342 family)